MDYNDDQERNLPPGSAEAADDAYRIAKRLHDKEHPEETGTSEPPSTDNKPTGAEAATEAPAETAAPATAESSSAAAAAESGEAAATEGTAAAGASGTASAGAAEGGGAAASTVGAPIILIIVLVILASELISLSGALVQYSMKDVMSTTWYDNYVESVYNTFGKDSLISKGLVKVGGVIANVFGFGDDGDTDLTDYTAKNKDKEADSSMINHRKAVDKALIKSYKDYSSTFEIRQLCRQNNWDYSLTRSHLSDTNSASWQSVYSTVNYGTIVNALNLAIYGYKYEGVSSKSHEITSKKLKKILMKDESLRKLYTMEVVGESHVIINDVKIYYGIVKIHPVSVQQLFEIGGSTLDSFFDNANMHNGTTQKLTDNDDKEFDTTDYGFQGQNLRNKRMLDFADQMTKGYISNDPNDKDNLIYGETPYNYLKLDNVMDYKTEDYSENNNSYRNLSTSSLVGAYANMDLSAYSLSNKWYSTADDYNGKGKLSYTFDGWMNCYDGPTEKSTDATYEIDVEGVGADVFSAFNSVLGGSSSYRTDRWCSYEFGPSKWKSSYQGVSWQKGPGGSATANGRYLVAVGPGIVARDYYSKSGGVGNNADWYSYGNLKMDLVLKDSKGNDVYVPVTPGDSKAHTYPFGVMQTGIAIPKSYSDQICGYTPSGGDFGAKGLGTAANSSDVIRNYRDYYDIYSFLGHGMIEWCYAVNSSIVSRLDNEFTLKKIIVYNSPNSEPVYNLTKDSNGTTGQDVVTFASKYVGKMPYVWGGESLETGADCSGFTMLVYRHFGYSLPHSSYAQGSCGVPIAYENAMPGDLIVYSDHVGIYIGNGVIVNASNEKNGTKYSNVQPEKIVAVRRIIGTN